MHSIEPFSVRELVEENKPTFKRSSAPRAIVVGALTGAIEICITYPTEFVKTQLQLNRQRGPNKVQMYTGIWDCIKKTLKKRGILGLYSGLDVVLIGTVPKVGVRFFAFQLLKEKFMDDKGHLTASKRLLCGLGAGITEAVFVVTPMETVKVKFIDDQNSKKPKFKGFLHGVRHIIKKHGFKGVYKGFSATVAKQGSNQAIRFLIVESCKHEYKKGDPNVCVPKLMTGLFGALAGAASVAANTPIDVVKTRMQSEEGHRFKSSYDCMKQIWDDGGAFAFYRGTVPRLSRVCADVAITFMLYDTIMDVFNIIWP